MALRNIVVEGDPILRKKCREVDEVNDRIRTILDDMVETMHDAVGVGLAAPQVGIMRRMFVAEPEPGSVYYFVNPEITMMEGAVEGEEGCLSVPGFAGLVERPQKITIKGLDRNGEPQEYTFEDFHARVMCHEFDHLDGILYKDKAMEMYDISENEDEEH
ncbi:MAG: peptide deformylase [Anaerovoracaceae bacterium]|nr:peptide deformylase [Anaerovoracaceae bacterium]